MATRQENHVCDNSTLANFKDWATSIGNALAAFGWLQTNDSGQVVWTATVWTLTQVAVSGGNAVYSYSSYTGPAPRVGMTITVSGFATGGNNVATKIITAISGAGSGTFTVAATTQVNETHAGSATTTAIAAVPSSTYVNEIWKSNGAQSGTTPIYLKMEYGLSTSNLNIFFTIGSGTDGAGTVNSNAGTRTSLSFSQIPAQGSTPYECNFSGDADEFRMMLWRNSTSNNFVVMLVVERSKDSSGSNTSDYFSSVSAGYASSPSIAVCSRQQTIYPGVGVNAQEISAGCRICTASTGYFNGTVDADMVRPIIGKRGNPMLGAACCRGADVTEGATVTVAVYGSTHTYVASKGSLGFASFGDSSADTGAAITSANGCVLMRFE